MSLDDAIRDARKLSNKDMYIARLGDGTGTVYDLTQPGNYWIRKQEAGGVLSKPLSLPVYPNANLPVKDGLSVRVGYDEDGIQCIIRASRTGLLSANISPYLLNPLDTAVYGKTSSTSLATFFCQRHGDTTNFPLSVVVFPGWLEIDDTMYFFPGGACDLTALVPAADLHCYATVFIKSDLTLEAFASTPVALTEPLTETDINECIAQRSTNSLTVWAWQLFDAMTALSPDPTKNVDLRQWMNVGSGGGGGAPTDAHYVTTQAESALSNEFNLGSLTSGLLKQSVSTGVATPAIATAGTDYTTPTGTENLSGKTIFSSTIADYWRRSVRAAAVTGTVDVASAPATLDGVTLATGDRILLWTQGLLSRAQNGIWTFNGTGNPLVRPVDSPSGSTVFAYQDMIVWTREGDTNAGRFFQQTNTGTITIDTNNQIWSELPLTAQVLKIRVAGGTMQLASTPTAARVATFPDADFTVVGVDLTQTLTNKTLTSPTINTPTLTVLDNALTIEDNGDPTKAFQFQASGITAGQTRIFTVPNFDATLATLAGAETLTNKTLTTPTIASFTNATHNHTDAAGGGQITDAALSAAVGATKGGTGQTTNAKGDLFVGSGSNTIGKLTVGANRTHLVADSAETTGTKWQAGWPFAVIEEQQAQNTAGGTSTATTWTTRVLNTEVVDASGIVSIGSNLFTPIAGTYKIHAESPFNPPTATTVVRIRLYNNTAGTEVIRSTNFFLSVTTAAGGGTAMLDYIFTANGTDAYAIQYYITAGKATNGLGVAINETSAVERYTRVVLELTG